MPVQEHKVTGSGERPELPPLPEVAEVALRPSRGRPMSEGRLRSMRAFEWVDGERVTVPFRPSPGLPVGWSGVTAEEV